MAVTREQITAALESYKGKIKPSKKLRAYLLEKIPELSEFDQRHELALVDVVLEDLDSYA